MRFDVSVAIDRLLLTFCRLPSLLIDLVILAHLHQSSWLGNTFQGGYRVASL
jgi:hypothetical protein